jgi:anti-sigma factor ChrR (cupin superfamily)
MRSQNFPWKPHSTPGVQVAILYTDPIKRELSGLLKAAPGVRYPLHRHAAIEEIYMLEGDLIVADQVYGAGDYLRSHPGSMHAPHTEGGCMFFFRTSMDDEYGLD